MNSQTIRSEYLRFFNERGHQTVPSSPLVPSRYDPTLLFTNAGMNQFKDLFLGKEKRDYMRTCSSQKCLRVSGKHNDIEQVGFTARHHTFFEMLGNFSFGDYFKKEAILWAWELVTSKEWFNINPEWLYATVFEGDSQVPADEEAKRYWLNAGVPEDRILYFGRKDNFWQMGDTGPCGPCSEIHIDRSEQLGSLLVKPLGDTCDKCQFGNDTFRKCQELPNHEQCERYVELWNLVFPQYEMQPNKPLQDLPQKGVDTGGGLERFAAVLQNVASNYETDLFSPIISQTEKIVDKPYGDEKLKASFRVIADHVRALVFAVADGVTFSNEGRGYVLRRILRRALRHGRQRLEYPEPFLHLLVDSVINIMGETYTELKERKEFIKKVIQAEEESFSATLDRGLVQFQQIVEDNRKKNVDFIGGEQAFKLYETYGFPLDMTIVMAKEVGMQVHDKTLEGYDSHMQKHRERSRVISRFEVERSILENVNLPPTEFVGYADIRTEAKVLFSDEDKIALDVTPFYAESGGQIGDTGRIIGANFEFKVADTRAIDSVVVHFGTYESDSRPKTGEHVTAEVDKERRNSIIRNHTATHLLQWALREVLGNHVKQSGSFVGPERLRFDFTHFEAMTNEELEQTERLVNRRVLNNSPVSFCEIPYTEALEKGAMAIFEEKYSDMVRMVETGDYSKELCGGTHVSQTGQIGLFHILSETSIKAGIRRIEAVTGEAALDCLSRLNALRNWLLANVAPTEEDIKNRIKELSETEKIYNKLKAQNVRKEAVKTAGVLAEKMSDTGGLKHVFRRLGNENRKELSTMTDRFRSMKEPVAICLISGKDKSLNIVVGASKAAVSDYKFHSGKFAKEAGAILGGSGGGRPDFAQAGGSDASRIDEVEKAFLSFICALAEK